MASDSVEDDPEFYSKAEKYWKDIPATVDGMLGGYGHISSIDINSSRKFLLRFLREGPNKTGTSRALDCGAGIGRITKRLLLPLFKAVDMVDVTEGFLDKAKNYLGEEGRRVGNYFCCGLQDFSPEPNAYDVIWIQWVIGQRVAKGHPASSADEPRLLPGPSQPSRCYGCFSTPFLLPPHFKKRTPDGRPPSQLPEEVPPWTPTQRHHCHQRQHGPGGGHLGRRRQQRLPGPGRRL
ncbi:hypothetical protein JRQ81_009060 [Phrynocephalus forsythii]|uniref:protein N-terminal methyltransferase n=1 Tax=Phrynocephalus forsythii TaxID=171643 RepID=A0A9Q1ASI7_9SAUR|nr:hypothetical protein JRQ81_009060 [Phrynocephalus forsythii]